jgi:hypothetical protein
MRLVSQLDCRSSETSSILVRGAKCRAAHGGQPVSKSGEQRSIRWLGANERSRPIRLVAEDACLSSKQRGFDSRIGRHTLAGGSGGRTTKPAEKVRFLPGVPRIALARGTGGDPPKVARRGSTPRGGAAGWGTCVRLAPSAPVLPGGVAAALLWQARCDSTTGNSHLRPGSRWAACFGNRTTAGFGSRGADQAVATNDTHEWRNRQTPRSQKPVTLTGRAGSIPVSCTSSRHGGTANAAG